MDIKKILILVLSILICLGAILTSKLLNDNEGPKIKINNDKTTISCKTTFDELLKNASASDNEGIKEFFIEEKNFVDIVNNRKLTYVAIDNSDNVTKEVLYIEIDKNVANKKIETIKPLEVEYRHDFIISDYFRVTNGCGWEFDANLEVSGMDLKKIGTYDIVVKALKDSSIPVLETKLEVIDFETPIITLKYKELILEYGENYDFRRLIEKIEDNKDSEEDLFEALEFSNIDTSKPGKQELKISVKDSDGKTSSVTIMVTIKENKEAQGDENYVPPVNNDWQEPNHDNSGNITPPIEPKPEPQEPEIPNPPTPSPDTGEEKPNPPTPSPEGGGEGQETPPPVETTPPTDNNEGEIVVPKPESTEKPTV